MIEIIFALLLVALISLLVAWIQLDRLRADIREMRYVIKGIERNNDYHTGRIERVEHTLIDLQFPPKKTAKLVLIFEIFRKAFKEARGL